MAVKTLGRLRTWELCIAVGPREPQHGSLNWEIRPPRPAPRTSPPRRRTWRAGGRRGVPVTEEKQEARVTVWICGLLVALSLPLVVAWAGTGNRRIRLG